MKKWYLILAVLLVIIYYLFAVLNFNWIENLELVTLNFRMKLRGEVPHQDKVKIVAIDDRSLSRLYQQEGNAWPWSRGVYAEIIEKLKAAGARSVIMDISFDTYRKNDQEGDRKFAETLFFNPEVTIGTTLINNKKEFDELDPAYQNKLKETRDYLKFRYKISNIDEYYLPDFFTTYKLVPPEEMFRHAVNAYSTFEIGLPGADGIYHAIPLIINEDYMNQEKEGSLVLLPNIDILGLASYLGIKPGDYVFDIKNKEIQLGNKLTIPVDSSGYFNLNYYGKRAFSEIPAVDVLNDSAENLRDIFEGKIVLIGYTAQAKGIFDARPTPFNSNESGIQLHATLLENILDRYYLKRLPFWLNLLLIGITFLISVQILRISNLKLSILLNILFIFLINLINYILFINNIWMDLVYLDLILVLYLTTNTIIKVYRENRERIKTKNFFSRYAPAQVVDEILKNPEMINPGGQEKEITVLFTDIVNFTGISEQLQPSELVRLLNEYLSEMSTIIKNKNKGTLDKFIGDAIVAIFGAPFSKEDDPIRAVNTALDMKEKAEELQDLWKKRGEKIIFDLGVGISTGKAVVGNIGSQERVNYTCIGDSVNVAARLEAATREAGFKILISDKTYSLVKNHFICRKIEELAVKGKKESLTVYSVISRKN